MANAPTTDYPFGSADDEHERLIRQATRLESCTERFFRAAGIADGQSVLDIGSGVGDVAMLVARMVGPSGQVVGVERDSRSLARARARVTEAGLRNVSFIQADVGEVKSDQLFDAAVGRMILQFVPDPVAALHSLSALIRPGGVVAFQELSYAPYLALSAHLPLWFAVASIIHETIRRSGAKTEIGIDLFHMFQKAGLPAPAMLLEMPLGSDPDFTRLVYDLIHSLRPRIEPRDLETLGEFGTLRQRLAGEVAASQSVVPYMALVGTWCSKL
jgi:SAM-dependent methyltransferase